MVFSKIWSSGVCFFSWSQKVPLSCPPGNLPLPTRLQNERKPSKVTATHPFIVLSATCFLSARITATVAYMSNVCHASFSTIRKFFWDIVGETVSRGYLSKVIQKVSQALERPYEELLDRLPFEPVINVDETGHKENGDKFWTWVFNVSIQFCIAHLIRDLKFLTGLPDDETKASGKKLLDAVRDMFRIIHQRMEMGGDAFLMSLEKSFGRGILSRLMNKATSPERI